MPFEAYRSFINELDKASPEFWLLANSYIERRQRQGSFGAIIEIACQKAQAQSLLNVAVHACPAAAVAIEKSISRIRDS